MKLKFCSKQLHSQIIQTQEVKQQILHNNWLLSSITVQLFFDTRRLTDIYQQVLILFHKTVSCHHIDVYTTCNNMYSDHNIHYTINTQYRQTYIYKSCSWNGPFQQLMFVFDGWLLIINVLQHLSPETNTHFTVAATAMNLYNKTTLRRHKHVFFARRVISRNHRLTRHD